MLVYRGIMSIEINLYSLGNLKESINLVKSEESFLKCLFLPVIFDIELGNNFVNF